MMLTFIIVDDTIAYRRILRQLIQSMPSWRIVGEAINGMEALQLVTQHRPDVVLMDVNIPLMNGVDATRQIKQLWPQTRVIVLSGYDDEEFHYASVQAGADYFLRKEDVDAMSLNHLIVQLFDTECPAGSS